MKSFKYGKDRLTCSIALSILHGTRDAVIDQATKKKIQTCFEQVTTIVNNDQAVYGINTGFGPLCNTQISKSETGLLQKNLLISHAVGVGNPIDKDIAKLMLILKVHALSKAYSGISIPVLNRIMWHIKKDIIPVVPEQGSVGASGDLAPLSHLFLPLLGEGKVFYKGKIQSTKSVLKKENKKALTLPPKAGLALINGTQFIAAHAIMVVDTLHSCLAQADIIAAMMIEGLYGSISPFTAGIHSIRAFKGNQHVAARVYKLLKGSQILKSHNDCDRVQDPYSLRCTPQVHGTSRNAWLHLKECVEIEINSVTDNPIVFSAQETISGGNFHGQPLALPLDYACLAAAELGNISDRRAYFSLEGKDNRAPKLLLKDTGLNSGFMIVQYTGAALVSENKGLCFPSSADSIPTSLGQEDHVSMGSIGSRKALQVCKNVEKIIAIEMLCAAQAVDFKRPLKSTAALEKVHAHIRSKISHATKDRLFGEDIEKAIEIIKSKKLLELTSRVKTDYDNLFEQF